MWKDEVVKWDDAYRYRYERFEPFLVPFSNIPYIYNGLSGGMIRGASCFAFFILALQEKLDDLNHTIDYLFMEDECIKEMSITSSKTIYDRLAKMRDFFKKHFSFFGDVTFENQTKLFVFTSFLDQLATDCFRYIDFNEPTLSNYITAYKNIDLLAEYKGLSKDEIKKYKEELLELLSIKRPTAYFSILFKSA